MEEAPKEKKPLSDKKMESLKKARVALVKSRDEKRKELHESAFNEMIEKKIADSLSKIQVKPSAPVALVAAPVVPESETEEIIEIVKKPKAKKKIIVVADSEEEEEELPRRKAPAPKKKKPVPRIPRREVEYVDPREERQQLVYEELYRNIFGGR